MLVPTLEELVSRKIIRENWDYSSLSFIIRQDLHEKEIELIDVDRQLSFFTYMYKTTDYDNWGYDTKHPFI